MVLKGVYPLNRNVYLASIEQRVTASKEHQIFVFVHGFNNSFEDAARRAAELTFDLGFEGAPILFSWPSNGGVVTGIPAYLEDQKRARESAVYLRIFLNFLATRTSAKQIHVIVHSMGNYVFENALSRGGRPAPIPALTPKLHEVVLAAPDIGDDEVRILAGALRNPPAPGPHVTVYASTNDNALKWSIPANHRVPIGLIKDGHIPSVPGADVIDASALDCDFLGHSCFAQSPFSLLEIRALINQKWEEAKRTWIAPKEGHWYFCGFSCPLQ
jgi:esterase/lipase superfamily enzyme